MMQKSHIVRLIQTAAACSLFAAAAANAQDRHIVTWTGRVDKEAQITIHDTTISTGIVGGAPVTRNYFRVDDRMPARDGFIRVELDRGRGDVDVIQQPSASNEYTAIVRIRDKSVGKDTYTLAVFWNPKRGEDRYSAAAADARANAGVQPPNTMHWSGTVDAELKIEWRGDDVKTSPVAGETAREVHSSVSNALPAREAQVVLIVHEGRGDVSIIQQPKSSNGYTAILKVRDPQSGFGHYDFDVTWH